MRANRSSLLTRIGSGGLVAVLAAGGAMASATAASAATGHAKIAVTTLSIKNRVIAHARHHADAISGVLRVRHTGVAGETVTLESRTGKKPRWTAVASGTTAANGSVGFTVAPSVRTQFKLVFSGDATHRRSASNVITLRAVKK